MSPPTVVYEQAPWQVRIDRGLGERTVGAGLYCSDGYVLTCAHVINPEGVKPGEPVYVSFQHAGPHERIPAVVADNGWWPPSGDGGLHGDVAVLRLTAPPPREASSAPLRAWPTGASTAHTFYVYGYPWLHESGGVPARGTIVGRAEFEWLSLVADPYSQGLDPGFSGSPVWDVELGGVIGIVVLRDKPRSSGDRAGRGNGGTAYAIRMEVLGVYWPPLQPMIVARPVRR